MICVPAKDHTDLPDAEPHRISDGMVNQDVEMGEFMDSRQFTSSCGYSKH